MINNSAPFYTSLIDSSDTNLGFVVNAGEINSFILSTYKAKYDEIKSKSTIEQQDYYARKGEEGDIYKTFKFGDFWNPIFYTNSNCDIYLTIPKIPAAFDSIPQVSEGLRKDWWLKPSNGYTNFLNQFKIVKNTDDDFDEEKTKNINSIYTDDTNWKSQANGAVKFLKDSDYSGKIYIKLADINPSRGFKNSVNRFFISNVISPTRYIRYGSLILRNLRLYVDVFGLLTKSIDIRGTPVSTEFNWKTFKFFHQIKYENFNLPEIFDFKYNSGDKTVIRTDIISPILSAVNAVFPQDHYYDFIGGKLGKDTNTGTFLEQPLVGRIIAVYKTTLGGPLIIDKITENIDLINGLVLDSNNNTASYRSKIPLVKDLEPMTEEKAINRVFGWPEKCAAFAKQKKLISFLGFT